MAFSLPIIVFEFNYLYNLDRDEEGFHFDALQATIQLVEIFNLKMKKMKILKNLKIKKV